MGSYVYSPKIGETDVIRASLGSPLIENGIQRFPNIVNEVESHAKILLDLLGIETLEHRDHG
jgi:hypothetical protein